MSRRVGTVLELGGYTARVCQKHECTESHRVKSKQFTDDRLDGRVWDHDGLSSTHCTGANVESDPTMTQAIFEDGEQTGTSITERESTPCGVLASNVNFKLIKLAADPILFKSLLNPNRYNQSRQY